MHKRIDVRIVHTSMYLHLTLHLLVLLYARVSYRQCRKGVHYYNMTRRIISYRNISITPHIPQA